MSTANNVATVAAAKAVAAHLLGCTDIVFSANTDIGFECLTPTDFDPQLVCTIAYAGPVAVAEWAGESQWTYATACDKAAVGSEFAEDPKLYTPEDVQRIQALAHETAVRYALTFRPTIEALADELDAGRTLTDTHVASYLQNYNPRELRLAHSQETT